MRTAFCFLLLDFSLFGSDETRGCEVTTRLGGYGARLNEYDVDYRTTICETGDVVTSIGFDYHP